MNKIDRKIDLRCQELRCEGITMIAKALKPYRKDKKDKEVGQFITDRSFAMGLQQELLSQFKQCGTLTFRRPSLQSGLLGNLF
jgi:hypothetical protein